MSFWNLSDGENVDTNNGEFETGSGNIEPIPDNTEVLAVCDEAKWDETTRAGQFISLRWTVVKPADYKNRKVFQKIRVEDEDPKKADKAKRMLAAIDANAGGKLVASGQAPTDENLTKCLTNKPMVLRLQVWELEGDDGNTRTGNWVSRVAPKSSGGQKPAPNQEPDPVTPPQQAEDDDLDKIPF